MQTSQMIKKETADLWVVETEVGEWLTWVLTRQTVTGELDQVRMLMMDLPGETMPSETDHVTVTSLIVTEMASGGTVIVMKEVVTGIAMTTGTAETMMEVMTLVVEEVVVTLVVVSAVIMMTVRVAMIATGTGIVTEIEIVTGTGIAMGTGIVTETGIVMEIEIVTENGIVTGTVKTGMTGVKRELLSRDPS